MADYRPGPGSTALLRGLQSGLTHAINYLRRYCHHSEAWENENHPSCPILIYS
jgi:hypothetical protein